MTAKNFVLNGGVAGVEDKNFKDDDRIKKIIPLQIQNELIPYTLFGTLPPSPQLPETDGEAGTPKS